METPANEDSQEKEPEKSIEAEDKNMAYGEEIHNPEEQNDKGCRNTPPHTYHPRVRPICRCRVTAHLIH